MSFSSRGTRRKQLKHLRHCSIITCNAGTIFCINYYVWSVTFSVHAHCARARSLHLLSAMFKVNSFPVPNIKGKKKATLFIVMMIVRATCGRLPCQPAMKDAAHDLYAFSSYSRLHLLLKVQVSGRANPASEEWGEEPRIEGRNRGRRAAMSAGSNKKVACVTGGSGYIGSALVKMLLEKGYAVKTTVRNPRFGSRIPLFFHLCFFLFLVAMVKSSE